MTKGITELKVNDQNLKAKGTYLFGKTAKQYADNEYNEELGKNQKGDGVTTIFIGLMQQDPEALIKFWHCATAHYRKDQPQFDDVAETIETIAEDNDLLPYFVGALKLLNEGGYYKGKLQTLWFMMNRSLKNQKGEEKDDKKAQVETFVEMYENITGSKPYSSSDSKA